MVTDTSSSATSPADSSGMNVMVVEVDSSSVPCSSTAPHDEQKLEPVGFWCPHWLQNTPVTGV